MSKNTLLSSALIAVLAVSGLSLAQAAHAEGNGGDSNNNRGDTRGRVNAGEGSTTEAAETASVKAKETNSGKEDMTSGDDRSTRESGEKSGHRNHENRGDHNK